MGAYMDKYRMYYQKKTVFHITNLFFLSRKCSESATDSNTELFDDTFSIKGVSYLSDIRCQNPL